MNSHQTPFRLRTSIILTIMIATVGVVAMTRFVYRGFDNWSTLISTLGIVFALSLYISFFLRTLQKNPTPLRFGLVGDPGSGKTVFLSVLFHEIQTTKNDGMSFQPYGRETVEEVTRNINMITRGEWLPSTEIGTVVPFRANARIDSGLFPKRYTVEIGDFAGEHIGEFDSTSEQWLHRTKYFDYITDSDVLFLAIDGNQLTFGALAQTEQMLNNLIASFQILLEERGIQPGKKTTMPVAILILKSDRLSDNEMDEDTARHRLSRLLKLCNNRCYRSETFFVSAVGWVRDDGSPPPEIHPRNVCDPMLWALKAVRL